MEFYVAQATNYLVNLKSIKSLLRRASLVAVAPKDPQLRSLHDRCAVHNAELPPFLQPQIDEVLQAIPDLFSAVKGCSLEEKQRLTIAIISLQDKLEILFQQAFSQMGGTLKPNWATPIFKRTFFRFRNPLPDFTMAAIMERPADNNITSACLLLHSVARVYFCDGIDTMKYVGTDGKSKKFEVKQLSDAFATVRLPKPECDVLQTSRTSRHIVVWARGRAFRVDIVDNNDRPVALSALAARLGAIWDAAQRQSLEGPTVATLSTHLGRPQWFEAREVLIKECPESINILESAITSVTLHDRNPESDEHQFALTKRCPQNVYSDQTLGYSIFPNGSLSVRLEHSALDAGAGGRILGVVAEVMARLPRSMSPSRRESQLQEVLFPQVAWDGTISPHALRLPKKTLKLAVKCEPRVLKTLLDKRLYNIAVQLAYQAALHHVSPDQVVAVTEPTATRQFFEGRCDPNFVTTDESMALCKALGAGAPSDVLRAKVDDAVAKYRALLNKTRKGAAVGPSLKILMPCISQLPNSEAKAILANAASAISARPAYFAGISYAPRCAAVEAHIFFPNQIALTYIGHETEIIVCMTGSGKFADALDTIGEVFEASLKRIIEVTVEDEKAKPGLWAGFWGASK